jgi:hypothetical protein
MPYINDERKKLYEGIVGRFEEELTKDTTEGDLNYIITCLILEYLVVKGLRYKAINEIRGAVHNCISEFYRRLAVNYEDEKIDENGDVYKERLGGTSIYTDWLLTQTGETS